MSDKQNSIEQRVRDRAYALWEKDEQSEGKSDHHWRNAQSEIEAEDAESGVGNTNFVKPVMKPSEPPKPSKPAS